MRRLLWVLILLLVAACKPPRLERTGVPLHWGMRLSDSAGGKEALAALEAMHAEGYDHLMVEIPLVGDSLTGLPGLEPDALPRIREAAAAVLVTGGSLSLGLATTNYMDLFPNARVTHPDAWFARVEALADSVLLACGTQKPERLVFGCDLYPSENYASHWTGMLTHLREKHSGIRFSYAFTTERLRAISFLPACDEISIAYAPTLDEDVKAYCREQNARISAAADSLHKPVYIYRANLLGTHPGYLFLNRLRFWYGGVSLAGIHLNTLYSRTLLQDSTSHFGVLQHPEFLETLHQWRAE